MPLTKDEKLCGAFGAFGVLVMLAILAKDLVELYAP